MRIAHGIAVHVHVEHVHEDRDANRLLLEKGGLVDLGNLDDLAIGRCDHDMLAALAGALRIAKEVCNPDRDDDEHDGGEPERPRTPIEGERKGPSGDQCRNDNEQQSFAGEAHVGSRIKGWPVIRR